MFMHPGAPLSFLMGIWAALSSAVASRLTKNRLRAALLTGLLMSLWPQVEMRLQHQPLYQRGVVGWMRLMSTLYSLQHRRRREEYEHEREEMIERFGFDPQTGGPPEPETLLRVIPIAQTVGLESESLMMLSIESYAEGFIVHIRLLSHEEPEPPELFSPIFSHSFPEVGRLDVRDDRGNRYLVMQGGGGGSDRGWRFEFRSGQPLDPQARELTLEIPEIRWERHEYGHPYPAVERVERGPWTFTVRL